MNSMLVITLMFATISLATGQDIPPDLSSSLHSGLTERIGNFSLELLYHISQAQPMRQNLVVSPITVWSVLAVTAEGSAGNTLAQINNIIRVTTKNRDTYRGEFKNITQLIQVKTNGLEFVKSNVMFVDQKSLPLPDFKDIAKNYYGTELLSIDFKQPELAANIVNEAISNITHGKIPKLVDPNYFTDSQMILTSAIYFKGEWTVPFNASSTSKLPFFSSDGKNMGEVNMMYNRFTYPFANIQALQARVLELPYGTENRLSMLIMLPYPGVSVESMFLHFNNITLDKVFQELQVSKEDYGNDEVDCSIPRFKIESNIDLTPILRDRLAVFDLFDASKARLFHIARTPLFVSKIVHKAEMEVTEQGTTASAVTAAEFINKFGIIRFEANRPFTYLIIEKVTNSIVFGGFYTEPSLY